MTATLQNELDPAKLEACMGKLIGIYSGSALNYMIDLGHRTGLFAAAAQAPATLAELSERAGLTERYVKEWLGAMVTGGIVDYDGRREVFSLAPEWSACLTEGPMNLAPIAALQTHLGKHVHKVARAFREGGGVPYSEFRPEFTEVMDAVSRTIFDQYLVEAYLPLVVGLEETLERGASVADVACGTGHALVVLARRFPASSFVGYDLDEGAIARARAEAAGAELDNVSFEVCDAARLKPTAPHDVVFVFDAIHDQVDPATVLARIWSGLAPGGRFVMKEPRGGESLEADRHNPMAPILYSTSTLHCLTISLAHGGAGIGTVFSEALARSMLGDAGFVEVSVHPAPGDPAGAIYSARKPAAASRGSH